MKKILSIIIALILCIQLSWAEYLSVCASNVENLNQNCNDIPAKISKIVSSFHSIDADIFALCEVRPTTEMIKQLTDSLNNRGGKHYAYISPFNNNTQYHCCVYLYNTARVTPVGDSWSPYESGTWYLRLRLQQFEDKANHGKFTLSINHFKSYNETMTYTNACDLTNALQSHSDPNVLIMGDLNSEYDDDPCQQLALSGYTEEVLARDASAYSYIYQGKKQLIDHCFASNSMRKYVKDAKPLHVNTGSYNAWSDHDPVLAQLDLSGNSRNDDDDDDDDDDILSVSDAISQYNAGNIKDSDDSIKVKGIVASLKAKPANFSRYGSICVYVTNIDNPNTSNPEFQFYNCYSYEKAKFENVSPAFANTSSNTMTSFEAATDANGQTIHVGDTVAATGTMTLYNNSIYELNTNCYLIKLANNENAIEALKCEPSRPAHIIMMNGRLYIEHDGQQTLLNGINR